MVNMKKCFSYGYLRVHTCLDVFDQIISMRFHINQRDRLQFHHDAEAISPCTPQAIGRRSTQLVKGLSRKILGTAGLVLYADILVPVLGTSKLAESNAGIAVKICIDQLCSQIVTDRRNYLTRDPGTVHILIFMLLCLALERTGLALEEWTVPIRLSALEVCMPDRIHFIVPGQLRKYR